MLCGCVWFVVSDLRARTHVRAYVPARAHSNTRARAGLFVSFVRSVFCLVGLFVLVGFVFVCSVGLFAGLFWFVRVCARVPGRGELREC